MSSSQNNLLPVRSPRAHLMSLGKAAVIGGSGHVERFAGEFAAIFHLGLDPTGRKASDRDGGPHCAEGSSHPAFGETSLDAREQRFATALHHARMTIVSGLHHETLIRRQSNTSAIPPIPTANKDRPRRLLCARFRSCLPPVYAQPIARKLTNLG